MDPVREVFLIGYGLAGAVIGVVAGQGVDEITDSLPQVEQEQRQETLCEKTKQVMGGLLKGAGYLLTVGGNTLAGVNYLQEQGVICDRSLKNDNFEKTIGAAAVALMGLVAIYAGNALINSGTTLANKKLTSL